MPRTARPSPPPSGYAIRVASRMTSIPADTLRVWERRYGFPRPARRDGGSRLYSDADIETLRLITRGLAAGYRPNDLVGKAHAEVERLVRAAGPARPAAAPPAERPTVASIVEALLADDAERVRTEVRRAAQLLGARAFVTEIAGPLAHHVGELWAAGGCDVRHEHFVSECLVTQMRVLLAPYEDTGRDPVVLLATLPGEQHGLGLAMVALCVAAQGATARLLGVDTPVTELAAAARALRADVVGVTVTPAADRRATAAGLRSLRRALPAATRIWVGGSAASSLGLPDAGFTIVSSWADLDAALDRARAGHAAA